MELEHSVKIPRNSYASPRQLFVLTTIAIFVFEAIIMVFFSIVPPISEVLKTFLDASLLSILMAATLYFFLYRPLTFQTFERARAEELAEEKRKYADELNAIFNAITDLVIVTDGQGNPVRANPAAIAALGFNPVGIATASLVEQFSAQHADGHPMKPEELPPSRALRGETIVSERLFFTNPQGITLTVLVSASPLWTNGQVSSTVMVAHDITERERAEERNRHLASYPQLNPNPIIEVDSAGAVIFFNPATQTVLENLGTDPSAVQVFLPLDMNAILRELEKKSESSFYRELIINDRVFGETIYLTPQFNAVRIHVFDITERKRSEAALRDARDELELRVRERTTELEKAIELLRDEIAGRKRIEERVLQNAARSETLARVATRLNAELGLDTVLTTICKETVHALGVSAASLSLYNEKCDELEPAATFGLPPEFHEQMRPIPRALYDEHTSQKGSSAIFPDVQTFPDLTNADLFKAFHVRTSISTRLEYEGKLVGALDIFTLGEPGHLTENELALLSSLARQATQAITTARLYAAELQAHQIAETLTAANLALTTSLSVDTVIETLLDFLARLVPYDSANIMLLEAESRLTIRAVRGYEKWTDPERTRGITFDAQSNPIIRAMFATRQSQLIPDTAEIPGWERPSGAQHVRNWLGVPLVAGGNVIGIYSLDKAIPGFFTEAHRRLAEALAAQAAIAVQNAWLFEQVRAGREGLQSLSRRLVEVQETERGYVARELHDEAGQLLTGLKFGLRVLEREAQSPEAVTRHVGELRRVVDDVLENLHRLAMHLRPATLDQLGLVAALHEYVASVKDKHALAVEFETVGFEDDRLPSPIEIALYRIVQEALTNIVRHARATQVQIILERFADRVKVTIDDNGTGFDLKQALQSGRLGLLGMQERVEMLNGKLTIESDAGEGTILVVEVPYGDSHFDRR